MGILQRGFKHHVNFGGVVYEVIAPVSGKWCALDADAVSKLKRTVRDLQQNCGQSLQNALEIALTSIGVVYPSATQKELQGKVSALCAQWQRNGGHFDA